MPLRARVELGVEDVERAADILGDGVDPSLRVAWLVALSTLVTSGRRQALLDRARGVVVDAGHGPDWADRPVGVIRDPRAWLALHEAYDALSNGSRVAAETLADWRALAEGVAGIDGDRLRACCLELSPAAPPDEPPFPVATPRNHEFGSDAIHDGIPPYFVSLARTFYRAGLPAEAERVLDEYRQLGLAQRDGARTRQAEEALVWLACRMRWPRYRPTLMESLTSLGGTGAVLVDAYLALTEDARHDVPAIIDTLRGQVPDWLGSHIALELELLARGHARGGLPGPMGGQVPDWPGSHIALELELLARGHARGGLPGPMGWLELFMRARKAIDSIAERDPVSACQIGTVVAAQAEHGWPEDVPRTQKLGWALGSGEDPLRFTRRLYEAIPDSAGLGRWGDWSSRPTDGDPWRAWLERWANLDVVVAGTPAAAAAPVSSAPMARPAPTPGMRSFPAGRDLHIREVAGPAAPPWGTGDDSPRRRRSLWWPILGLLLFLALGYASMSTGAAGESGRAATRVPWGGLLSTGAFVLTAVYGLRAIVSLFAGLKRDEMRRRVGAGVRLEVRVPDAGDGPVSGIQLGLLNGARGPLRAWLTRPWNPVRFVSPRPGGIPLTLPDLELRAWATVIPAVLRAPPESRARDWEHELVDVSDGDLWRVVWIRPGEVGQGPSGQLPLVALRAPRAWDGPLRGAYGDALGTAAEGPSTTVVMPWEEARMHHLVGIPGRTRSGAVLRIGGGESSKGEQPYTFTPTAGRKTAWLTVLQTEPAEGLHHRDVLTSDAMRELALGVQRETRAWVLSLPALPVPIAIQVWGELAGLATQSQPTTITDLVHCAGRIKAAIVSSVEGPERTAALAVAQDVLLIGPTPGSEQKLRPARGASPKAGAS